MREYSMTVSAINDTTWYYILIPLQVLWYQIWYLLIRYLHDARWGSDDDDYDMICLPVSSDIRTVRRIDAWWSDDYSAWYDDDTILMIYRCWYRYSNDTIVVQWYWYLIRHWYIPVWWWPRWYGDMFYLLYSVILLLWWWYYDIVILMFWWPFTYDDTDAYYDDTWNAIYKYSNDKYNDQWNDNDK